MVSLGIHHVALCFGLTEAKRVHHDGEAIREVVVPSGSDDGCDLVPLHAPSPRHAQHCRCLQFIINCDFKFLYFFLFFHLLL